MHRDNHFRLRVIGAAIVCLTVVLTSSCATISNIINVGDPNPRAAIVEAPQDVQISQLQALIINDNGDTDQNNPRHIGYATSVGLDDWNKAAEDFIKQQWIAKPTSQATAETTPAPVILNVKWAITVATGPVLAQRLTATWSQNTKILSTVSKTIYTTVPDGKAVPADALFTAKGKELATRAAARALAAKRILIGTETIPKGNDGNTRAIGIADKMTPNTTIFANAIVAPDGGIIVAIEPGTFITKDKKTTYVHLPVELVKPMLTGEGKKIAAAVVNNKGTRPQLKMPKEANNHIPLVPQSFKAPVDCFKEKCIALTYDDGPGPYTKELLNILKAEGVHATFFLIGRAAKMYPELVREEITSGHDIGNHTWNHPNLNTISDDEIRKEINETNGVIKEITNGVYSPSFMRPPYGNANNLVAATLKTLGMPIITWSVDTSDWRTKSTEKTISAALKGATAGAIILMHDVHESTVKAAPAIIKELKKRGYVFVTISEMFDGNMNPGIRQCGQNMIGKRCGQW